MEDVTKRVQDALKGARNAEDEFAKRKDVIAAIERDSLEKTGFRSDVVTLYQGGEYSALSLQEIHRRAHCLRAGAADRLYGGDPDNFTFPRYDLDMALFRVYENNQPIKSPAYLKWNAKGAARE